MFTPYLHPQPHHSTPRQTPTSAQQPPKQNNMATTDLPGLEDHLSGLGLKTPIPDFPTAEVLTRPLDIARSYLADILHSLVECEPSNAYNSIQWPGDIQMGDLAVILPKLSHGAKPADVASGLMQKVCLFYVASSGCG
jgi:hypothetical protein